MLVISSCNLRDNFMELCYEPYLVIVNIDVNDERQVDFSEYEEDDITLMRAATDVVLYVFDNKNQYLGHHLTKLRKVTKLPYHDFDSISIISVCIDKDIDKWSNMLQPGNYYSDTAVFKKLEKLSEHKKSDVVSSPSDFMFDRKKFGRNPYDKKNVVYYMYVRSMVGAMKIRTKNMEEWANKRYGDTGMENDVFTFVVGKTLDEYDFRGKIGGKQVAYKPTSQYISSNEISTPMFNMYPTIARTGVSIEIFRNGEPIFPDPRGNKKYAFSINRGWCMLVTLSFDQSGGIDIETEDWGNVDITVDL